MDDLSCGGSESSLSSCSFSGWGEKPSNINNVEITSILRAKKYWINNFFSILFCCKGLAIVAVVTVSILIALLNVRLDVPHAPQALSAIRVQATESLHQLVHAPQGPTIQDQRAAIAAQSNA